MFCDHCGATVEPGAKFCEECGASLGGTTLRPPPSLVRGLRSKGWLWLLAGVGVVLLIVGGVFFAFRGNVLEEKGSLSRKKATQKIQAYSGSVGNDRFRMLNKTEYLVALREAGYISGWEEVGSSFGEPELTEKGKHFMGAEFGGVSLVLRADFNSGTEVTGITIDPGGVTAIVQFTVAPSEPLRILRKVEGLAEKDIAQPLPGVAQFRLYDDGWRVERVGLS